MPQRNSAPGLRTWLPSDVEKQDYVTNTLVSLYRNWGYEPISIPTLVDMEVLKQANVQFRSKTFKVVDKDGELLALRPEFTPSIAKAVSSRFSEFDLPLRLYYNSTVFRHSGKATDDTRELSQTGIEFVGPKALHNFSNAEILHLCLDSVKQFGAKDCSIVITHVSIWQKVFADYPEIAAKAFDFLERGNLVEFKKLVPEAHPMRVLINSNSISEVEKTLKLDLSLLKELEFENVIFDPSLCPDIDFYTGIYFNMLAKGHGKAIAIGGRYDNLYKAFGVDVPAIGFAYYIPDFITVLQSQNLFPDFESKHKEIKPLQNWHKTVELAQKEISKGNKIKLKLDNNDK